MAFSAIVMGLNLQKLVIPGSEIQSHLEKIMTSQLALGSCRTHTLVHTLNLKNMGKEHLIRDPIQWRFYHNFYDVLFFMHSDWLKILNIQIRLLKN